MFLMNDKIFLSSPHMSDEEYEMQYIKEAFETNWIAPLGKNVDMFEKELSELVGVKTGAALSSGTAAIHLALKAVDVGKDDIVFCSSLTFSATVNPVIYQNATPVFIDSDYKTWNMSPTALRRAFEKYTPKAVIVVNLYGQSADMDEILSICKEHNVPVIEDAAESLGTTYKGKYSGTFGQFGIYSFNGNKIITTSGGGMLVSNDEERVKKIRFWSTQSRDVARHYQHSELGYNYRMSNIVAGIGRGQLKVLKDRIFKKKQIFQMYEEAFKDIADIKMMPISSDNQPNYWLSCITLKEDSKIKPLEILLSLEKENIESRPIWKPMNLQPYFEKFDFIVDDESKISVSEDIFNRGLCLPSDTKMLISEQKKVISIIKGLWN